MIIDCLSSAPRCSNRAAIARRRRPGTGPGEASPVWRTAARSLLAADLVCVGLPAFSRNRVERDASKSVGRKRASRPWSPNRCPTPRGRGQGWLQGVAAAAAFRQFRVGRDGHAIPRRWLSPPGQGQKRTVLRRRVILIGVRIATGPNGNGGPDALVIPC